LDRCVGKEGCVVDEGTNGTAIGEGFVHEPLTTVKIGTKKVETAITAPTRCVRSFG
jgi:hypothetical protein